MLQCNPSHPEVGTLIDENLLFKVDVLNFLCVEDVEISLSIKALFKTKTF